MKKIFLCSMMALILLMPKVAFALEKNEYTESYISYSIEDEFYVETIIEESAITTFATQKKTGSKTKNYKTSTGKILYSIKVSGTFTYTGSSSTCTASYVTATSYDSTWKVASKSSSKSKNVATAKATMKHYYDNSVAQTTYPSVSLTCSAKGVLS